MRALAELVSVCPGLLRISGHFHLTDYRNVEDLSFSSLGL